MHHWWFYLIINLIFSKTNQTKLSSLPRWSKVAQKKQLTNFQCKYFILCLFPIGFTPKFEFLHTSWFLTYPVFHFPYHWSSMGLIIRWYRKRAGAGGRPLSHMDLMTWKGCRRPSHVWHAKRPLLFLKGKEGRKRSCWGQRERKPFTI